MTCRSIWEEVSGCEEASFVSQAEQGEGINMNQIVSNMLLEGANTNKLTK